MKFEDIFWALLAVLLLSGSHVVGKIALTHFPPICLTAIRMSLVALVLLPFIRMPPISLKRLYFLSFLQYICHHLLFIIALAQGLPAGVSAIASQLSVPFTTLLGIYWLKDIPTIRQISGMIISFVGIGVVIGAPNLSGHIVPFMLSAIASLVFAIFNIQIKQIKKLPILSFIAWTSLLAAPQLFILSWFFEPLTWSLFTSVPEKHVWPAIFYMVASIVCGLSLWFYLLQKYSVNLVVPFSLLIPVLGVIFADTYLKEPLTWHIVVGGTIIIWGLTMIINKNSSLEEEAKNYVYNKNTFTKL